MAAIVVPSYVTAVVGVLAATYAFLWALLLLTQDPKEPPIAPSTIPFITPILEMKKKRGRFYSYMRAKFPRPIYTLRLPGSRLYVINSTSLIPAVQRQFRTLSFSPLQIRGSETILGASPEAMEILNRDVEAGDDNGFLIRIVKVIHPYLTSGPTLDALNKDAIQVLERRLSGLAAQGPQVINMYDWVRKAVMTATTDAVYGPQNPMRDPATLAAWTKFESKVPLLTLGILPKRALKEGLEARAALVKAFDKYFSEEGYKKASRYLQARVNFYEQEGIPEEDKRRFELGHNIALSSNTLPTSFWLVYHIFSDPVLLEECRKEVSKSVDQGCIINYEYIKKSCPILQSVFWEVFRIHGIGLVPRRALEDVMLDDRYLIKKGGTVFIPYRVQHHDPAVWGGNEGEFYYRRFIKEAGAKRHNPAAFRGFGSGAHLCPGRHFASAELLLFATMMILRFDAKPVAGSWPRIPVENSSQVSALDQPDHDVEVEFTPRQGVSQDGWGVNFAGTEQGIAILNESNV